MNFKQAIVGLLAVVVALSFAQTATSKKTTTKTDDQYYKECKRIFDSRVLDAAYASCKLALTLNPNHFESLVLSGRIALIQHQYDVAKGHLEAAVRQQTTPETQYLQGRLALETNDPKTALQYLGNLNSVEALSVSGKAYEALDDFSNAYTAYSRSAQVLDSRLGIARIAEPLGKVKESLQFFSANNLTPEEQLARSRMLWVDGQGAQAVQSLEGLLRLPSLPAESYNQSLGLLSLAQAGLGQFSQSFATVNQLASKESIPTMLLNQIWPWIAALLGFLGLMLFGESRIEPVSSVEMIDEGNATTPSFYGWVAGAFVLAAAATLGVGWTNYNNLLAAFTPLQKNQVQPVFFLVFGAVLVVLALIRVKPLKFKQGLGNPSTWTQGVVVGIFLALLLMGYSYIAKPLGLSHFPQSALCFVGLALAELVYSGLGYKVFSDRYKELAVGFVPLVFALTVPGPTLFYVAAAFVMAAMYRNTKGSLAGVVGWLVCGLAVLLLSNFPEAKQFLVW